MRSAPGRLLLSVLALCCAACTGSASPTTISTTTSLPGSTSTLPPPIDCPGAGDFEEGGGIADVEGELSDSSLLGSISWDVNDRCESFVFEFETSEGAPATSVPDIQIGHLDSFQVIRISLGVNAAVLTDQLVETDLVERLYVVRSLEGGLFVDLHLSSPAGARARVQSSPATLTVDLRPGLVEFVGTAETGENVVLVSPTPATEVGTTTELSGYSRTFEANVTVIVTQIDEVVVETSTIAADYIETWGEFRTELTLPPGDVSVFVGEASPEDGSLSGITVDLTVS
ncbi:MAG: Gmad2 immunoglobulin-like domain-containing protein [Acidimicrobiia bacterium]|jgi:hypothetical protein